LTYLWSVYGVVCAQELDAELEKLQTIIDRAKSSQDAGIDGEMTL
jgi:hypothetical protein